MVGKFCICTLGGAILRFTIRLPTSNARRLARNAPSKRKPLPLELLDYLQNKPRLAVLRYEIRLNSIREIKRNLKLIGQDVEDISFRRLFSLEISRAILLRWWKEIFRAIPKMPLDSAATMNHCSVY